MERNEAVVEEAAPAVEQRESAFVQAAKVVGIAGVTAGVVGGILGRVLERRREPTAGERLQAALDDVKSRDGSKFSHALVEAVEAARADFESARRESRKRGKKASKRASKKAKETDYAALAASGITLADHVRRALADSAGRLGENVQDALEQTTESIRESAEETRKASMKRGEQLRKQAEKQRKIAEKQAKKQRKTAEKQASEGLEELMKFRKDATHKAEDRFHNVEKLARKTVEKRVKPALEKAGAATLVGASEARHWIQEESKDFEKRYADVKPKLEKRYTEARPKLEKSADRYADVAGDLVKDLRKVAQERAGDAEHLLQEGTATARQFAQEGPGQVREFAQEAGDSAKEGGKNATSLVIWTAIAGGLIYQVLLDDEQKRKVREVASSVFHEGRAIYQDVRGENADFSAQ